MVTRIVGIAYGALGSASERLIGSDAVLRGIRPVMRTDMTAIARRAKPRVREK